MSTIYLRRMTSLLPVVLIVLNSGWRGGAFNVYEPVRHPTWHYFGFSRPQTPPSVLFREPMAAMVDLTNDLGVAVLQDYSYSRSNFAFSPYGVASVLVVLYEGARGESAMQIHRAVRFPWDRDITRIGFRDIHRHLRTYFSHEGYLSGITLSKEGSSLKPEYKRILRFYGYDVEMDATGNDNATVPSGGTEEGTSPSTPSPTTSTTDSLDMSTVEGNDLETSTNAADTIDPYGTTPVVSTMQILERTTPALEESNTVISTTSSLEVSTVGGNGLETTTANVDIDSYGTTTAISTMQISESTTPVLEENNTVVSTTEECEIPVTDIPGIVSSTTTESAFTTSFQVTDTPDSDASISEHFGASTITDNPTWTPAFTFEEGTVSATTTAGVTDEDSHNSKITPTISQEYTTLSADEVSSMTDDYSTSELPPEETTTQEMETKLNIELDNGMLIPQDSDREKNLFRRNIDVALSFERGPYGEPANVDENEGLEDLESIRRWRTSVAVAKGDFAESRAPIGLTNRISYSRTSHAKSDFNATGKEKERTSGGSTDALEWRSKRKRTTSDYLKIPPVPDLSLQLQNGMFDSHVSKDSDLYRRLPKFLFLVDGAIDTPVPMMTYVNVFAFAYVPRLHSKALEFPLDDDRYKLLILLPVERRGLRQLIYDLGKYPLREVINVLRPARVKAMVPTFMVEGFVILTPTLQKLGIWDVFDPRRADLSGMTSDPDLYVRNIEQSVTVVIRNYVEILDIQTRTMAARLIEEDFIASHPFLYFVMDTTTNVALMAGQMLDPLNSRIY